MLLEFINKSGQGPIIKYRRQIHRSISHALSIKRLIDIEAEDEDEDEGNIMPRARLAIAKCPDQFDNIESRRQACRYLLGRVLDSISGSVTARWCLEYQESGAPWLISEAYSGLSISMARTGPWLAASVALSADIGIDIERIKPRPKYQKLADFLNWSVPLEDANDFYANWALWEASAKCVNGSVFMHNNCGFEQLCQSDVSDKLVRSGPWFGMRQQIDAEVFYAVVLNSAASAKLSFRSIAIQEAQPWNLHSIALPSVNHELRIHCA